MKSLGIWIKAVILISVLLMNMHRADMTLDEIEVTLQFKIAADATHVTINPEGPLNFLRGLIYQKMECVYNKRFFAPQIDTEYILEEEKHKLNFGTQTTYKYNRNGQKDKAYTAQSTNKMDVYAEQYHNHLIQLFPSPTGDITIETRGNQSFVQFLRAKDTEKHSLKILAMLLLFSEGVDIPIKVTNSILEVYEKDKKDKIYFTVPMEIPWLNIKENREETFQQKKVKQLIKFFKEYATNDDVLSMMMDKCTKEEVSTGKFLDSPKFLIQSYIFGFIDTAEHATEFIQTMHTMTEKYASKTKAPSKTDSVYDRLFKPAGSKSETDCMGLMKDTQEILNMHKIFPFANNPELPAYKSIPRYNRKTGIFSTDHVKNYSNCVECMILSLFCCLAYDPNDFTYKTDHMGNVSEELKEFFTPEENKSFDTTKAEFQKEWCRVVADLGDPRIAYCKDRNELDCGLINMLMVIAEIANISKDEKDIILGFSETLKKQNGELDYKLCESIEKYTKELLKRLSRIEIVEIYFSSLKSDLYSNERYDISGKITVTFEKNSVQNMIMLEISEDHSTIDIKPVVMKFKNIQIDKLNEVAFSCKNTVTFVESLFAAYIEYEIRKIDTPENNKEFLKEQVRKTIENDFVDMNRLLLIKKISDFEHKKNLVTCLIIYSMNKNLLPGHPVIQLTSNVIGSTEINNRGIQAQILPPILLAGLHSICSNNLNYPNIKLLENTYDKIMVNIKNDYFVEYVLDCDISIFIKWIKYCIENLDLYNQDNDYEVLYSTVAKSIYEYIFRDGDMKYANVVNEAIAQECPEMEDIALNYLHNIWFIYLIAEENPNQDLIKTNFHAIRSPIYTLPAFGYRKMRIIIQNLNDLEAHLCIDKESILTFDRISHTYIYRLKFISL
ncbi:hypothetical protein NEAUS03_0646 [Nematocida ausubeli]|nr:hypothetical protein NEAUS03_0646 [Nematocida ausubeli]